jgi:hypothetical protein
VTTLPPSSRPCQSCPYRRDVPSGVWDESEYDKLPPYDSPTYAQPGRLFNCHQHDPGDTRARICGGWAGCHDMHHSAALRIALVNGKITPETYRATLGYVSPVPLFASGAEAREHGIRDYFSPGPDALAALDKIRRTRSDLI